MNHSKHKILHNITELQAFTSQAMQDNASIVFTNGCFDILHAGHLDSLEKAKNLGDVLIVGVNSDASVRRLKGNARPIVPLQYRMELLAGLECVDAVIAFEEDTPEQLIKSVSPDILVKGNDYKVEEIAGAKHVIENGGKVELITFEKDISTSAIINKIKNL